MPRRNHKFLRTCLGCQMRDERLMMVRVAMAGDALVLEQSRRLDGRGGYLHRTDDCLQRFVRSRVKEFRSLRRAVAPGERMRIAEVIRGAAQWRQV